MFSRLFTPQVDRNEPPQSRDSELDLQQLHVWDDAWADDDGWQRAVEGLKRERLITSFGISVNRWEPANVLRALETGLVDSVQVVYNIFDQAPGFAVSRIASSSASLSSRACRSTKAASPVR